MSTTDDAEITIQRLRPPLGGVYHFAAKIRRVQRSEDGIRAGIRLPFDEVWGETEDEARRHAEAMIARLFCDVATADTARMPRLDADAAIDTQVCDRDGSKVVAVVVARDRVVVGSTSS